MNDWIADRYEMRPIGVTQRMEGKQRSKIGKKKAKQQTEENKKQRSRRGTRHVSDW